LAPTVINKMNRNLIRILAVILIISYGKVLHAQQNFKEAYFKSGGKIGFQKFLQNKFSAEVKKHQLDICLISATFAEFRIDTTGNIKDLVFFENHDTPQVFREVLVQIISKTNGLWIPAQINGKATESKVYILPLIYEMAKSSAKLSEHFNSPEFRAKSEELRKMSDSLGKMSADKSIKDAQEQMNKVSEQMRAYQNSPELKKIQEEMRQASMGMQHYQNSPELKKLQEQMRITQKKMQEYFNSPEFKKQMEALKNQNWKMDTPDDKTFAPDKPNFAPDKPDTSGKN